jgi:hypothetical protein
MPSLGVVRGATKSLSTKISERRSVSDRTGHISGRRQRRWAQTSSVGRCGGAHAGTTAACTLQQSTAVVADVRRSTPITSSRLKGEFTLQSSGGWGIRPVPEIRDRGCRLGTFGIHGVTL